MILILMIRSGSGTYKNKHFIASDISLQTYVTEGVTAFWAEMSGNVSRNLRNLRKFYKKWLAYLSDSRQLQGLNGVVRTPTFPPAVSTPPLFADIPENKSFFRFSLKQSKFLIFLKVGYYRMIDLLTFKIE